VTGSLVANETTVSIVRITFGNSLIDGAQVQVDRIVQIERQSPILHGNEQEEKHRKLVSVNATRFLLLNFHIYKISGLHCTMNPCQGRLSLKKYFELRHMKLVPVLPNVINVLVSDIAIFVLKRDVKLQLSNCQEVELYS